MKDKEKQKNIDRWSDEMNSLLMNSFKKPMRKKNDEKQNENKTESK